MIHKRCSRSNHGDAPLLVEDKGCWGDPDAVTGADAELRIHCHDKHFDLLPRIVPVQGHNVDKSTLVPSLHGRLTNSGEEQY